MENGAAKQHGNSTGRFVAGPLDIVVVADGIAIGYSIDSVELKKGDSQVSRGTGNNGGLLLHRVLQQALALTDMLSPMLPSAFLTMYGTR
jgi:hypothetical protein